MPKRISFKSKDDFNKYKTVVRLVKEIEKSTDKERKALYKVLDKSQTSVVDNYCPIEYLQMQVGLREILLLANTSIEKEEEIFNTLSKKIFLSR